MEINILACCAFKEFNGLEMAMAEDGPISIIREFVDDYKEDSSRRRPYVLFTQADTDEERCDCGCCDDDPRYENYGEVFAEFLRANSLGEVIELPNKVSWTASTIRPFLWMPDYPKCCEFVEAPR